MSWMSANRKHSWFSRDSHDTPLNKLYSIIQNYDFGYSTFSRTALSKWCWTTSPLSQCRHTSGFHSFRYPISSINECYSLFNLILLNSLHSSLTSSKPFSVAEATSTRVFLVSVLSKYIAAFSNWWENNLRDFHAFLYCN